MRRSIRNYEKRVIARDIIADILWNAAQAPTTPVSGPFLYNVIEGVERIADFASAPSTHPRTSATLSQPDLVLILDHQDLCILCYSLL
jgi:nitroreductase